MQKVKDLLHHDSHRKSTPASATSPTHQQQQSGAHAESNEQAPAVAGASDSPRQIQTASHAVHQPSEAMTSSQQQDIEGDVADQTPSRTYGQVVGEILPSGHSSRPHSLKMSSTDRGAQPGTTEGQHQSRHGHHFQHHRHKEGGEHPEQLRGSNLQRSQSDQNPISATEQQRHDPLSSTSRSPTSTKSTPAAGGASCASGAPATISGGTTVTQETASPPHHGSHKFPTEVSELSQEALAGAQHDHRHLAPVVHETRHVEQIEEVERNRIIDRHLHHVQLNLQPLRETIHEPEVHHHTVVPQTKVRERHINTHDDVNTYRRMSAEIKDERVEVSADRIIIDKGETVETRVHHHIHHLVGIIKEKDVHEHHITHVKIPIHERIDEAPIIYKAVLHQPMPIQQFIENGGDLASELTPENANVLHTNESECIRITEGPLENLLKQYGIAYNKAGHTGRETVEQSRQESAGGPQLPIKSQTSQGIPLPEQRPAKGIAISP